MNPVVTMRRMEWCAATAAAMTYASRTPFVFVESVNALLVAAGVAGVYVCDRFCRSVEQQAHTRGSFSSLTHSPSD